MSGYGYPPTGHDSPLPPPGQSYPYPPHAVSDMNPFTTLVPSAFPPGTDPNVVAAYHIVDEDGSGLIDDEELRTALSSCKQTFSLRTVRLLMYLFTRSNTHQIGSFPSLDPTNY